MEEIFTLITRDSIACQTKQRVGRTVLKNWLKIYIQEQRAKYSQDFWGGVNGGSLRYQRDRQG